MRRVGYTNSFSVQVDTGHIEAHWNNLFSIVCRYCTKLFLPFSQVLKVLAPWYLSDAVGDFCACFTFIQTGNPPFPSYETPPLMATLRNLPLNSAFVQFCPMCTFTFYSSRSIFISWPSPSCFTQSFQLNLCIYLYWYTPLNMLLTYHPSTRRFMICAIANVVKYTENI
jgi:hypothetical protein